MPAVSGLEAEFPGKVRARNIESMTEEGQTAVKELGFKSHGIVIRDERGRPLWKQPDHEVNMDDVRRSIRSLLGSRSSS